MVSAFFSSIIQIILQLTSYEALRASEEHNDVVRMLNERRGWAIDAYRSCFNINLLLDNTSTTLCTLVFLAMAEILHLRLRSSLSR
ncbi:hypothetical protein BU15DRAFT_77795 [Melanogaster broomeanus]|nr:hypothetical protein BU15DRAFT_77795 [Melanogaster broomeanus]